MSVLPSPEAPVCSLHHRHPDVSASRSLKLHCGRRLRGGEAELCASQAGDMGKRLRHRFLFSGHLSVALLHSQPPSWVTSAQSQRLHPNLKVTQSSARVCAAQRPPLA